MKKIKYLLVALVMLFLGNIHFSYDVFASESKEPVLTETITQANPYYEEVIEETIQTLEEQGKQYESDGRSSNVYFSIDDAANYLKSNLINRKENISFSFYTTSNNFSSILKNVFEKAMESSNSTKGNEGDYLKFHYRLYRAVSEGYQNSGTYYMTFTYQVLYYTNLQQENQVTSKVQQVLSSLNLNGKSEYEKVSRIYDYVTSNVVYDYAPIPNSFGQYTAYNALIEGKAVCQGYANLLYRMFKDVGLSVRIVPGTSRGIGHAWNIVKIGNYYYNLDSTWDAGVGTYSYFLKNESEFLEHQREKIYNSSQFQNSYPIAPQSYKSYEGRVWTKNADGSFSCIVNGTKLTNQWIEGKDGDGEIRYVDTKGKMVTNQFQTDGTYTYYLTHTGAPMKDKLTWDPEGTGLIYLDSYGRMVFDNFQYCRDVGYSCYFNSLGRATFDQIAFYKNKPYYLDGTGRMKQNEWFQFANGLDYGYANADGSLNHKGFSYDPWGRVVFYHWNGMVARGLITDGVWYYHMDERDGSMKGQFQL